MCGLNMCGPSVCVLFPLLYERGVVECVSTVYLLCAYRVDMQEEKGEYSV